MEALNVTYLWLLEWQAELRANSAQHSWKHLPKGTSVRLVSTQWLNRLWAAVSLAVDTEDISQVSNLALDNSDIIEGESPPLSVQSDKVPGKDYAVIPTSVYERVFSFSPRDRRQEIHARVAWRGLFKPFLFTARHKVAFVQRTSEHLITEVSVDDDETVLSFIRRFYTEWTIPGDTEAVKFSWWSMHESINFDEFQHSIATGERRHNPAKQKIVNFHQTLLAEINSPVVIADFCDRRPASERQNWSFLNGLGLKNMGKTCFLNSTLQCFLHIPQVVSYYLHEFKSLNRERNMGELMKELLELRYSLDPEKRMVYKPEEIYYLLPSVHSYSGNPEEEDANELFLTILELLHRSESWRRRDPLPLPRILEHCSWADFLTTDTPIRTRVFGGMQIQITTCSACSKRAIKYAPFCSLPLDLPASKDLSVTVIWQDVNRPQQLCSFQSRTPLEENEIVNTVRDCVIENCKMKDVIVGENRMMLLDNGFGLSNLVSSNKFIALELPEIDPSHCIVLVDFMHGTRTAYEGISTRAIAVRRGVAIEQLVHEIIGYLVQSDAAAKEETSLLWALSLSRRDEKLQKRYLRYIGSSHITICSVSSSGGFCDISQLTAQRMQTVQDLCAQLGHRTLRVRFFCTRFTTLTIGRLRTKVEPESIWKFIIRPKTDSDLTVTLLQLLEYTLRDKPMNEEDAVVCGGCRASTQLITAMQVARFPNVLPIVLQRVRLLPHGLEKSHIKIQYPLDGLDLTCFEKGTSYNPAIYDLLAVIHHSGRTLSKGHYVAYARNPMTGCWVKYDDKSVEEVDQNEVVQEEGAYMLFYSRRL